MEKFNYGYYLKQVKKELFALISMSVILAGLLGFHTYLLKVVYDQVFIRLDEQFLFKICLAFLATILSSFVIIFLKKSIIARIEVILTEKNRLSLMEEIMHYRYQYFVDRNTGDINKRIVEDCAIIGRGLSTVCSGIANTIIIALWLIFLFFFLQWIFLPVIGLVFMLAIWFICFRNPLSRTSNIIGRAYSKLYRLFYEVIPGIKVIKYELLYKPVVKEYSTISSELRKTFRKNTVLHNLLWSVHEPLVWAVSLYILFYGVNELQNGNFTLGLLTAAFMIIRRVVDPLFELNNTLVAVRELNTAFQRIEEYRCGEPEAVGGQEFRGVLKGITISNLQFSYPRSHFSLNIKKLHIEAGQSVGFFGKTGFGKSTLINLLIGLYVPQKGNISFDGVDLSRFNVQSIRENIIVVPQEINLYPVTLQKNIDIKNRLVGSQMDSLLRRLSLDKLVADLPQGLQTPIVENGGNFSGGERQRIGIARALALQAHMYVFDEVTANLDPSTSKKVVDCLYNLGPEVTTITVSHDLSLIPNMDKIFVVTNGTVLELDNSARDKTQEDILKLYAGEIK